MVNRDEGRIGGIVRDALKRTGNCGVIHSGWSDVKSTSSADVLYLDVVPHDWLLPRCNMIIYHCGAGTTSSGLRVGISNIIVPFTADQPY